MISNEIVKFAEYAQAAYEELYRGDFGDILAERLKTERGAFTETQAGRLSADMIVLCRFNYNSSVLQIACSPHECSLSGVIIAGRSEVQHLTGWQGVALQT